MGNRLHKVKLFYNKERRLPSYSEMCILFGVTSKDTIHHHIQKWIQKGILQKTANKLTPASRFFDLPLLGSIQAGKPSTDEAETKWVSLNEHLFTNPKIYVLKVTGDSMIEEGIREGDLVLIDQIREPKPGDIVAACVDQEWTLKYFEKKGGVITLKAANPNYKPIIPKDSLTLGGVVVKVIRNYY